MTKCLTSDMTPAYPLPHEAAMCGLKIFEITFVFRKIITVVTVVVNYLQVEILII